MIKIYLVFIFIILSKGLSYGKTINEINQIDDSTKIIAQYYGGKIGCSSMSLFLYDDSTYKFSEWMHTGYIFSEIGRFSSSDSLITFYPKKSELKNHGKRRKKYKGQPQSHLIDGENILMYNPEEYDNEFSAEYKTLYKNKK